MKRHIFLLQLLLVTSIITFSSCNSNNKNNGCLKGVFSVSESKKIHFSQGNLQYQASTNTWRFAENQWDIVGDDNEGNVYIGEVKSNNHSVSEKYDGWIDLFCWGTGLNPCFVYPNASDLRVFNDWGANAISNGGNEPNKWRTLTRQEVEYIFKGRSNAEKLFAFGRVNGRKGLIILPDDWTTPKGLEFCPSTSKGMTMQNDSYYGNGKEELYSHNNYIGEQWNDMETAGAVFLPATGYRANDYSLEFTLPILGAGQTGYYWLSSPYFRSEAYLLCFSPICFTPISTADRIYGQSVRLVCSCAQ